AVQLTLIWLLLTTLGTGVPGAVGACVSLAPPASGVFMSVWISLVVSARPYSRTSSIKIGRASRRSLDDVPLGIATGDKLLHHTPSQCFTCYPVAASLSVAAVQLTLIWLLLTTLGTGVPGAVGACVSLAPPASGVFMSVWISLAVSARPYTRTSSI